MASFGRSDILGKITFSAISDCKPVGFAGCVTLGTLFVVVTAFSGNCFFSETAVVEILAILPHPTYLLCSSCIFFSPPCSSLNFLLTYLSVS